MNKYHTAHPNSFSTTTSTSNSSSTPNRSSISSSSSSSLYGSARSSEDARLAVYTALAAEGTDQSASNRSEVDELFRQKSWNNISLKPDASVRPIYVDPEGHIWLETFSPIYKQAYDFLIAIAEPICRPELMHEYQLTTPSLYAAVSVGLQTEDIISVLDRLSKNVLPPEVKTMIRSKTESYGKLKLVLQRNRYFVESLHPELLKKLHRDSGISSSVITPTGDLEIDPATGFITSRRLLNSDITIANIPSNIPNSTTSTTTSASSNRSSSSLKFDDDDDAGELQDQNVYSFEIDPHNVEEVKQRCNVLQYPMLEEYDFRNDTANANLDIDLKPTTTIRSYQEKSLSKMFGNGRARSGIIVLPCGAGKTLVGITAACTVKKSTLVLCTSSVSVEQWIYQFKHWSTIVDKNITRFTSDHKGKFPNSSNLVVTTYSMITFGGRRSDEAKAVMEELAKREWGLLLLDEVHVVPAQMFRNVFKVVHAHCKLGLTATLVREDSKIGDLNFLIGPKLYEANWLDLQKAGHIATVQCIEVWCTMTPEFYRRYLTANSSSQRTLLYVMNPNKFRACQFLIRYHEQRGDKIIVFSDNLFALRSYSHKLGKPFIDGSMSEAERMKVLSQFQHLPQRKCIFISKVGDTSIDLPEANVIIQISSHYGSRRQEAQRLGRILRPKARTEGEFNAFFYSLVSKDTSEMLYSTKRQQFLIDQGYSFKVITQLTEAENTSTSELFYSTQRDQDELLTTVLSMDENSEPKENLPEDPDRLELALSSAQYHKYSKKPKRSAGSMSAVSGGEDMSYMEIRKKSIFDRKIKHSSNISNLKKKLGRKP